MLVIKTGGVNVLEKNKVKVTIAGVDYALTTEETPEYTTMLAAEIRRKR